MNVTFKSMTVVIEGVTFENVIGEEKGIYADNYGVYIPDSQNITTFDEMILVASKWLESQE